MSEKVLLDGESTIGVVRDYEKPRLEILPDYLDTTLQQTIVIPTDMWGNQ